MDFSTATATPVAIKINGTSYTLQRFLLPQMKEWAAERVKAQSDAATAHLDDDAKARFLTFFQPSPVDIFDLARWARSPEGAGEIVDRQLKAANVPDDVRAAVLANADPIAIANLADQLASSKQAAAGAASMTEGGSSPLAGQPDAPPDSPGAGATS